MEILLIRHTTPALTPGLIYGRTDVGLTDDFETEAEAILQKLPFTPDAVYASPSGRCTKLASQLNTKYKTDERLYEVNFGQWEGQTWDTVNQQELQVWMKDFVHACPPEGESMMQMNERVLHFWHELLQQPHERVAVVTHGGVIRLILCTLSHTPLSSAFEIKIKYGDAFLVQHKAQEYQLL